MINDTLGKPGTGEVEIKKQTKIYIYIKQISNVLNVARDEPITKFVTIWRQCYILKLN